LQIKPDLWLRSVARIMAVTVVVYVPTYWLASALGSSLAALAIAYAVATLAYAGLGYILLGAELRAAAAQVRALGTPPAEAA
jgi:hypothetical protein